METPEIGPEGQAALENIIGYLNFSSGTPDAKFFSDIDRLFVILEGGTSGGPGDPSRVTWRIFGGLCREKLESLGRDSSAFRDTAQATAVLKLVLEHVLPAYLAHHRDLLFHQSDVTLFRPYFVGCVFEAVLAQGSPWDESERVMLGALRHLNDYIGHRPVATLETQKIEPYAHERVRPVPLYVRGAGVAAGRYHNLIRLTLSILEQTDEDLLRRAFFDPAALDELAVDPRAYDFHHPADKRPNYHFGQWDPHHIDNRGIYRRFVLQHVTLDVIMRRVEQSDDLPREERLLEAAAVLAGTSLMASGISGAGPGAHDSTTTLATLLPRIAAYRDEFYEQLLSTLSGPHARRLREEAASHRQPLGGARQHLNAMLAQRRAVQMQHVHLAKISARMGYSEAAVRQAAVVPVASARMMCQIDCHMTVAHRAVDQGRLTKAAAFFPEIIDLLHRAVECGAMVDPWNVIGFDGNYGLFPAIENSVHDHRVDELLALMEQIFDLGSRLWSEAAAADDGPLCRQVSDQLQAVAKWWHQFATHEVSSVDGVNGMDAYMAASHVAQALNLWHKGGAASGDIRFWAPHAEIFDSCKAFALVAETLLHRGDLVASMALLVHWLGQAGPEDLEQRDSSFFQLAERWVRQAKQGDQAGRENRTRDSEEASSADDPTRDWPAQKFLDYLEANAEDFWQVPEFELVPVRSDRDGNDEAVTDTDDDRELEEDSLFSAAYEEMVYRDSTDDGIEGEILDSGTPTDDEFQQEAQRIGAHLKFLTCLARLWKLAALDALELSGDGREPGDADQAADQVTEQRGDVLNRWFTQAATNHRRLVDLLAAVHRHRIPRPSSDQQSMLEYDRRRLVKDTLLERIVSTCVETGDALRFVPAAAVAQSKSEAKHLDELDQDERQAVAVFAAVLRGDVEQIQSLWPAFIETLVKQPLLYVPLSRGGNPRQVAEVRTRQRVMENLLSWLPRLGRLTETHQLIETARAMESQHPVGASAVTEFDHLFEIGYTAIVESVVRAAKLWNHPDSGQEPTPDSSHLSLVRLLERLTQSLLLSWLSHSQTLRLSVLERVADDDRWQRLVEFIQRYGDELFTQPFLNVGNLRAILYQGVGPWLDKIQDDPTGVDGLRMVDDLGGSLSREEAVEHLSTTLEAILENSSEYRDYNSTTTQSDHGELLYGLLDFLRLRVAYDRVMWNLKPVVMAHEILVRRGRNEAAELWRRVVAQRTSDEGDRYLERLTELQKKYAMRMPTVADRLAERFVRPMAIDRIRALVKLAIGEARQPGQSTAFHLLEQATAALAEEPIGVGLDAPGWLVALEDEVDRIHEPGHRKDISADVHDIIPNVPLTPEQIQQQLDEWHSDE